MRVQFKPHRGGGCQLISTIHACSRRYDNIGQLERARTAQPQARSQGQRKQRRVRPSPALAATTTKKMLKKTNLEKRFFVSTTKLTKKNIYQVYTR